MKNISLLLFVGLILISSSSFAQTKDPIVEGIVKEATENSQLEKLAHELMDGIGPRLVPQKCNKRMIGLLQNTRAGALVLRMKSGASGLDGEEVYHTLI